MRLPHVLLLFISFQLSFSQNYSYQAIPQELLQNADAVVRNDEMRVVILRQDLMEVSTRRVVTVLNGQGDRFVKAYMFYDNNDKINTLEARVFDKTGKEIKKIRQKDFFDQSAVSGGTLYSDTRILYLRYTPTHYPYTVEFTRVYTTSNTAFSPSWNFLDGYRVSTQQSKFTYRVDCNIPFRFKDSNLEEYEIQKKISENQIQYSGSKLKALEAEPMSPPFSDFVPNVRTSISRFHLEGVDGVATSWQDFGKWMHDKLLMGRDYLDPQTIKTMGALVKDIEDPYEKIQKVYEYVQDNTRYISVQLGIGGWMPISADEVDQVKYGDCKGLSNYTMALLKAVGVESYYTVLYASNNGQKRSIDPDFVSLQGNHVFLNIPLEEKELWLECTSQVTPINHLGTFSDDRKVLKITPNGGEIVQTKTYGDEENHQVIKAEFFVDNTGTIRGDMTIQSEGIQYDQKFRNTFKTKLEQEKFYKNHWDYLNNISLRDISFKNDKTAIQFQENIAIEIENYIADSDGKLLFAPNIVNRNFEVPRKVKERKRDLVIARGYLDEDEIIIHLPEGYRAETLFAPLSLETKFGSFRAEISEKRPGVLLYKREILVQSGYYPKEEYQAYRDFCKKIAQFDNSRIIVIKP
ncbi:DUF3857 domain-containing transglutaminase family protein [Flagellimonas meishanensis]|uniref:DUF3857 domain-containing transglutaminase family protein n=1 Tax=Flagellimonas meishanensis TaxID=2873264 RepID=UPI001CA6485B|nr:DUF3857 domain-containing transglutaminase family protein [[Muricauda] meishanensis]